MVKLIPTDFEYLSAYVQWAFEGDNELLEHYHISPGPLEHCVGHTMKFIEDNLAYYGNDIKFFAVAKDNVTIGYTVVIKNQKVPNELYSFGINKNYRDKETLMEWLEVIEEELKSPYYMILWAKNTRAIEFFKRNGFDEIPNKSLSED